MTQHLTRRFLLGGLGAALGSAALAKAPDVSLRPVLRPQTLGTRSATSPDALIASAKLGGSVGFSVVDVASGRVLEEHQGTTALPPASVTKSITALYALASLGAGFRFSTRLLGTGGISKGVLDGDLILAGGGDPTLDTNALAGLASKLKAAGIREVRGRLRTYAGALPHVHEVDSGQPDHVAYNPSISGLNLNFNRVHFEWKRASGGYSTMIDARSSKYRPDVRIARITVADRNAPTYTYRDAGTHDQWTVARGQLGNGGARWLPVRKPEGYAAEVFSTFARAQGIALKPGKPLNSLPRGAELARHSSAALTEILRDMLKYSNNMTAEAVGLTATVRRKGRVASLKASGQEMSAWARQALGMSGARFVDHSGLGAASRVTPRAMAGAMARVHRENALKPLLKAFPMRDANGNVRKNHPIKVSAKTGTLYFASTLSGYMRAPDGQDLAFAIFTINEQQRSQIDRKTGARPKGSRSWNKRSKTLQQKLIERWGQLHGS